MAEIHPFRGVHYNQSLINDWPAVICPTYDIISPQLQQELYLKSEYNFIRLEFGRELPQDTVTDNKYTRSTATLEQWFRQGVLEVDKAPAIYLHDQYFSHQGMEYKRRGIIARVRVEEWDKNVIRPHEGTTAEPKSDRLNLLSALQANTSPILALFEDPGQQISSLSATLEQSQPLLRLKNVDGEGHTIWAITEPKIIQQICRCLAEQPLYIADGHHRYESALNYQRQKHAFSPSASEDDPFNFAMVTLVDFTDPGLIVLPPHRMVRGILKPDLDELMSKLPVFFEIEELPLDKAGIWKQVDDWLTETDQVRLVLFGLSAERLHLLQLRDQSAVSQMMPHFHSEQYKRLDVSIVDHIILGKLLAMDKDQEKTSLAYSYDKQDAVNRVLNQEYQLTIMLGPVRLEVVRAIADAGDTMPRKSTYFYPKLPAGVILNQLV